MKLVVLLKLRIIRNKIKIMIKTNKELRKNKMIHSFIKVYLCMCRPIIKIWRKIKILNFSQEIEYLKLTDNQAPT
jgi:hypothetical protein